MQVCGTCKSVNLFYLDLCPHEVCKECLIKSASRSFFEVSCIPCNRILIDAEKKRVLGDDLFQRLESNALSLLEDEFQEVNALPPREEESVYCPMCSTKTSHFLYLECVHGICSDCFKKLAFQNIDEIKCPACGTLVSEVIKRNILGQEYDNIANSFSSDLEKDLIKCVNCNERFQFVKGKVDYNTRDGKNQVLSKEACEHYAENRCRCPKCEKEFCIGCMKTPYHLGKTCIENKKFLESKKCRYDDALISGDEEVCKNPECIALYNSSCLKVLNCGHRCFGHKNEKECLSCLDINCKEYKNIYDQQAEDYCPICFATALRNEPVVLLDCMHYAHYNCVLKNLHSWRGPKIKFSHVTCTKCHVFLNCSNNNDLQEIIDKERSLYELICKLSLERLANDKLDQDGRLTDPNSSWFGKKLEFALTHINYYMCYECKKPYFAGMKECRGGPGDDQNDPNREFDPKSLICNEHGLKFNNLGQTKCDTHGTDYIDFKCKFCCSIASWFCWGTTHFCEPCHQKQCNGDRVSNYPKDKLPKCGGPGKCQLNIQHPENGEEFGLGCSLCRNAK